MSLNGIDISSNNKGIDLDRLKGVDFAFIKATQGKTYINPYFKAWTEKALELGWCVGAYHYIGGKPAAEEVENFYRAVQPYIGRVVVAFDWEATQNSGWENRSYLDEIIKLWIEKTGIVPFIYSSNFYFPWEIAMKYGCPTWVAQYANMKRVNGFQANPWNEGAYECDIRQYTSEGFIDGWANRLDLNKAYITRNQWAAHCGNKPSDTAPNETKPVETPPKPVINLKGQWRCVIPEGVKIRRKASLSGEVAGVYSKGMTVWLDATATRADGYVWGTYIGNSGKRCYVAVQKLDNGKMYWERV